MPRVASVTRSNTIVITLLGELRNLFRRLDADFVAAAAPFHALGFGHRLIMNGWHRFHGGPCHRVLPFLELRNLLLMALRASIRSRNLGLGNVGSAVVSIAMAGVATDARFAVMALLPIGNDVGSLLGMATDAFVAAVRGMNC